MERKPAGVVPHLTSRMSTEVREGPTASLPPSGPDGWERPGLRTQRSPRGKCGSKMHQPGPQKTVQGERGFQRESLHLFSPDGLGFPGPVTSMVNQATGKT